MKKGYLLWLFAAGLLLLPLPAAADTYYIARGGETVARVAQALSLDGSLLALINDRTEEEEPAAGALLRLPEEPCLRYIAGEGDTVGLLAAAYGVSPAELAAQNGLSAGDVPAPGQELLIPLAEEAAAAAAAAVEAPVRAVRTESPDYSWPVMGVVTSPFGARWGSFHYGADIAVDAGTPVGAADAGRVTEAGWKSDDYGYTVMLDHGGGRETLYAHASALAVSAGDWVEAGQTVAYAGSTGNSTGPHVHFELRVDGVCVDPLPYLPRL